jgi:hypothetical protein
VHFTTQINILEKTEETLNFINSIRPTKWWCGQILRTFPVDMYCAKVLRTCLSGLVLWTSHVPGLGPGQVGSVIGTCLVDWSCEGVCGLVLMAGLVMLVMWLVLWTGPMDWSCGLVLCSGPWGWFSGLVRLVLWSGPLDWSAR